MKFKCAMCKKELEKPGAIVLSPPSDAQYIDVCEVTKFHICCDCYSLGIFQLITRPYHYLKGVQRAKKVFEEENKKKVKLAIKENPLDGYWTTFHGEGGYPNEIEAAKKIFEVGKRYRIVGGSIGNNSSRLIIDGVKGSWNSCLFDVKIHDVPILRNDYDLRC